MNVWLDSLIAMTMSPKLHFIIWLPQFIYSLVHQMYKLEIISIKNLYIYVHI